MRKLVLILSAVLIFFLTAVYTFIPAQLIIKKVISIESSERIIYDFLITNKNRTNWWPGDKQQIVSQADSNSFIYKEAAYKFTAAGFSAAIVYIRNGENHYQSSITSSVIDKNTIRLMWKAAVLTGNNPFKKILRYYDSIRVKQQMAFILENFGNYIIKEENIYGLDIKRSIVTDTLLLTTTWNFNSYPALIEIYNLVDDLQNFALAKGTKITNYPMLNSTKTYKGIYETMVALPVDRLVQPGPNIIINHMVPGNILVTEVKGGKYSINNAFNQLRYYMQDFKLVSPAMPFEMMVTDRSVETDTSKWITKIYYPVF